MLLLLLYLVFCMLLTGGSSHTPSHSLIRLLSHTLRLQRLSNQSALDFWNSEGCRSFYDGGGDRQLRVLEDLHERGRNGSTGQQAQEVVVSHDYKFVYVEVRKAASATIRLMLKEVFHTDFFSWCEQCPKSYKVLHGRCSSLCLSPSELDDYLFFTFVRQPVERFIAAYRQLQEHKHHSNKNITTAGMKRVLLDLLLHSNNKDEHTQTQCFALSTVSAQGKQLRLDFIGRMEHLERDWRELLSAIERHSGRQLPDVPRSFSSIHQQSSRERALYEAAATPEIMELATLTYAQDFVCLGYDPSAHLPRQLNFVM